jgi:hypothetical protein
MNPMAGLDPAIHVLVGVEFAVIKDVDARVEPGQGGFLREEWQGG